MKRKLNILFSVVIFGLVFCAVPALAKETYNINGATIPANQGAYSVSKYKSYSGYQALYSSSSGIDVQARLRHTVTPTWDTGWSSKLVIGGTMNWSSSAVSEAGIYPTLDIRATTKKSSTYKYSGIWFY